MDPAEAQGARSGGRQGPGEREAETPSARRAAPAPADRVEPRPPGGWVRKLLLVLPAALFLFLLSVLIWGILADLLAGY